MTLRVKDYETIVDEMLIYLQNSLSGIITDFNPGSVIRTFTEAIALQIGTNSNVTVNLYGQLQNVYNAAFISTATGGDLDLLVELVGVTRVPAVAATGVVRFYSVPAPVIDITILIGTQVSTQPDAAGNRIVFTVDVDTVLLALQTYVDVNVTAQSPGVIGNVAIGMVTYLGTPVFGITSINNLGAISGGVEEEDDATLRIRAQGAVQVSGNATSTALRLAVLGIAGVGSVTVDDLPIRVVTAESHVYSNVIATYNMYAPEIIDDGDFQVDGTFSASPHTFIKNTDYEVDEDTDSITWITGDKPDNGTAFFVSYNHHALGEVDMIVAGTSIPMSGPLVATVEAEIALRKAAGVLVTVVEPSVIDVDATCAVSVLAGYNVSAVKAAVLSNLTDFLNALDVGYDVYIADLYEVIQSTLGVQNSVVSLPAADVTISATEVARAGTVIVS